MQASQVIKEREERYKTLTNNLNVGVYRNTPGVRGKFIEVNPACVEMFGYGSREELLAVDVADLYQNPEDRQLLANELVGSGFVKNIELQLKKKDGASFVASVSAVAIKNEAGEVIFFDGIIEDVTERKKMEESLRESEERYRHVAEDSIDGIVLAQDGLTVYANNAFCRMFGYEKEEIIGESDVKVIAPRDQALIQDRTQRRLKGAEVQNRYVTTGLTKDGTEIIIDVSASTPFTYKGKPTVLAILRDTTEKRRMEEEILKAQKLESIGTLAGGIAHDFNNILGAAMGNISLAQLYAESDGLSDRIQERLAEADRATIQMEDLTKQLLIFSKGGIPIKELSSIGELLKGSAELMLRGSNVGSEFSIPDGLWLVEFDAGQMNQVINNMIINAKQAMSEGGVIRICAENVDLKAEAGLPLEPGVYVKISIQDQGSGIPEDHIQRIFDPFFTTKQTGSGLGLATSYSIIQRHGGHISVESKLGFGTTFQIFLPASPGATVIEKKKEEDKPIRGKGKILVMDDEKYIRDTAARILVSLGYRVVTVIDGDEAIEVYKDAKKSANPFDAVIIDLTIPAGMGGSETIRNLIEIDHEVNAIVSSGYSNDPIMAKFREYGFKGTIAKPYKVMELSEVLHEVLIHQN